MSLVIMPCRENWDVLLGDISLYVKGCISLRHCTKAKFSYGRAGRLVGWHIPS